MKALILAAGKGQRLGEVTKKLPKPMIEIDGKPILEHNLNMCRDAEVADIYINLHHASDKITNYFGDGSKHGVNITYNYERKLLGTAGCLIPFKTKLKNTPFFVIYGDNYTDFDLLDLKIFHDKNNADISILFHWRNNVSNSGIASFKENCQIDKFIEKPVGVYKKGGWVNAGVYYIERSNIFEHINKFDDFGLNVFPRLLENDYNIFGLKSHVDLIAIDTPELLSKNLELK
jgi:NDP-sugar pyrophosphorylase family protein